MPKFVLAVAIVYFLHLVTTADALEPEAAFAQVPAHPSV
jgi:hypothetical protein